MSLRHALLATLDAGPLTGYDLAKLFDQSASRVWHATHPQIYTELRRLEDAGLVMARVQSRGLKARAVKRVYEITGAGVQELRCWVGQVALPQGVRDPAYLRATYFEYAPPDVVRRQFECHRDYHAEQLRRWQAHAGQLRDRATELLERRLARLPQEEQEAVVAYKVHVYEGLAERARAEVAWAERGLALVGRLAGQADGAVGDGSSRTGPRDAAPRRAGHGPA